MFELPADYRMGAAEHGYLRKLEGLQRQRIPLTPTEFAHRVGVADTTAFRRYKVLKRALNEYGWQTRPEVMRGPRPGLLEVVDLGPDPEVERLEARVAKLTVDLEQARAVGTELADREQQVVTLRGLLMATVAHHTGSNVSRAQEIERTLAGLIQDAMPDRPPPDLATDNPKIVDLVSILRDRLGQQ